MAIDSAEKRRSVAGVGFWLYGPDGVTPNALKDREWRQQSGYGYSGISAATGGGGGVTRRRQHTKYWHRT